MSLDDLLANEVAAHQARGRRHGHPQGWEPGVKFDPRSGEGEAVLVADDDQADFAQLLAQMLPEVDCRLVEVTEVRAWGDPADPRKYIRAKVVKDGSGEADVDVETLAARIRKHRKPKRPAPTDARSLVVCLSDMQVGKAHEQLGGTPELIERFVDAMGKVEDRARALKKAGYPCGDLVVVGAGDNVERCSGNYPSQPFTTDLNERDQEKVARRLILQAHTTWANHFGQVRSVAVASNHGENRQAGKAITDPSDSADLRIWETVAEIMAANDEAYGHVSFAFSPDPMVVTLEVHGHVLAAIHGHQASGGGSPAEKMWRWWQGQAMGQLPAGDADILVAAHYHHYYMKQQQGRTLLGCPSLDGGSRWWTDKSGQWSAPGVLTFTVDEDGWSNVAVL